MRHTFLWLTVSVSVAGGYAAHAAAQRGGTAQAPPADLVLTNGRVVTVDDARPETQAIAVTGEKRSEQFPELPTMIEQGFKDFVVDTWLGFGAPAGLPPPLVAKLNAEFNRITDSADMRKKFVEQGMSAWPARSPEEALKFLHQDTDFWLPIIKASGATAE